MESSQRRSPSSNRLIKNLYRRRWARSALSALADGPHRQADLKVELVSRSGSLVHHRTFSNAMSYLESNHLVLRHHTHGRVVYEIAELGRELHAQLESLEQAVHEHHRDDAGQVVGNGPVNGAEHEERWRRSSELPPLREV